MDVEDEHEQEVDEEPRKIHIVITNKHLKVFAASACCLIGLIITLANMHSDTKTALFGGTLMFTALGMLLKSGLADD